MRLEIIVPDCTPASRKAKLTSLTERLSAHPELVDKIRLNGDVDDADIQKLFAPELLAEIDSAGEDVKAGNRASLEEEHDELGSAGRLWEMGDLAAVSEADRERRSTPIPVARNSTHLVNRATLTGGCAIETAEG